MAPSKLLIRTLLNSTSVLHACKGRVAQGNGLEPSGDDEELIICRQDSIEVYKYSDEFSFELVGTHRFFDRIEAILTIPPTVFPWKSKLLSFGTNQLTLLGSSTGGVLEELSSAPLLSSASPSGGPHSSRQLQGVHFSRPIEVQQREGDILTLVAAVMQHDHIQMVGIQQGSEELKVKVVPLRESELMDAKNGRQRASGPPRHTSFHIFALELLPDTALRDSGMCLLVLLHSKQAGLTPTSLDLDCLQFDWATGSLKSGPWACRNVHPSTSLLLPFDGTQCAGSAYSSSVGVMAISSRGCTLYCTLQQQQTMWGSTPSSPTGASASSVPLEPKQIELLAWSLDGLPTCVESLSPGCFILADSMASIFLVNVNCATPWMRRVDVVGPPLSPPSVLRFVPRPPNPAGGDSQAAVSIDGLLFIGSSVGNSQIIQLPLGSFRFTYNNTSNACQQAAVSIDGLLFIGSSVGNSQIIQLPLGSLRFSEPKPESLPPWPIVDAAFIKSLAPVQDCIAVPQTQGSDDSSVLVCSGTSPCGRLARARLAAGLQPYVADGPELPGGVQMFALAGTRSSSSPDSQPQHSLSASEPSLLMASLPGGHLLQLTSSCARLLSPAPAWAIQAEWKPPPGSGSLSLGSYTPLGGGQMVVATSSQLFAVAVDPTAGTLSLRQSISLELQPSALSILDLSPAASATSPSCADLCITLGDWVDNQLQLRRMDDLSSVMCSLDTGGPNRSPLKDGAGSAPKESDSLNDLLSHVLVVGTNDGALLLWELQYNGRTSTLMPMEADNSRVVRISNVDVSLEVYGSHLSCSHGDPASHYIYAHSGSDAIISLRQGTPSSPSSHAGAGAGAGSGAGAGPTTYSATDLVEVLRVHGGSMLRAVCSVNTPAMPASTAWVSPEGKLIFGSLDVNAKIRWTTAYIGGTPQHSAYHAALGCFVVLMEDANLKDMGDTPQHSAYHAASGCFVVLTEDADGVNWLRLVHEETMLPVLSAKLAVGHFYTALAVESMPCTSGQLLITTQVQAQGGGPEAQTAQTQKQFIVLASYLLTQDNMSLDDMAEESSDPHRAGVPSCQAVLSFFEITLECAPPSCEPSGLKGGPQKEVRYGLLLHGSYLTTSVCTSLSSVYPERLVGTGVEALLHRGHDGELRVYSVHIDDLGTDGGVALNDALNVVSSVETLPPFVPPPPEELMGEPGAGQSNGNGVVGSGDVGRVFDASHCAGEPGAGQSNGNGDVGSGEPGAGQSNGNGEGGSDGEPGAGQSNGNGDVGSDGEEDNFDAYERFRHHQQPSDEEPDGGIGRGLPAALGDDTDDDRTNRVAGFKQALIKDWSQHVSMKLSPSIGTLIASDFLGSITCMRLVAQKDTIALIPTASDK
eukprot:gene21570-28564_t